MKKRNLVIAVASIGVASTAIAGGALVTSSAMASTPTPSKASITVVTMKAGQTESFVCTFDDIPVSDQAALPATAGATGGPVEGGGFVTASAGVPVSGSEAGLSTTNETGTAGNGPTYSTGTVLSGSAPAGTPDPGPLPAGAGVIGTTVGPDGVVHITPDNLRHGTAEECASVRPSAIPAPPAKA